jgi:hypothetical protein
VADGFSAEKDTDGHAETGQGEEHERNAKQTKECVHRSIIQELRPASRRGLFEGAEECLDVFDFLGGEQDAEGGHR